MLLHAQKDYRVEVEHDETVTARVVTIRAREKIVLEIGPTEGGGEGTSLTLTEGAIRLNSLGIITSNAVGDVNTDAAGAVTIEAAGEVNIEGSSIDIEALDGAVVCLPFPI